MKSKPIYVEIPIEADIDRLWEASQDPKLHEQWDLRFSSITYLPKQENEPQAFTYKTNIGFGLAIEGWGKSVGSFHAEDDSRTSSLHFGTDQSLSIIREGRGYWKYIPKGDGVTFLTQYDYKVNFGGLGQFFDIFVFRPMIGWATALSFDVLKRWLEKGESPASQYIRFFSYWLIAFLFAFIWIYHGAVPKLVAMHPEEVAMVDSLLSMNDNTWLIQTIGVLEIAFGALWLLYRKKRHLLMLQLITFPILTLSALLAEPSYLTHPFNPLTFNVALFVVTVIGLLMSKQVPTATSCKRKRGNHDDL
ncbi:DoxX-like family protein [Radiobacillus sp. PE A8.2]|uniref:DoxX-like family protein n=1 Tax=Radiobacillus sp. PE A8.2 TaxID=3380349 RepID=UPI003890538D